MVRKISLLGVLLLLVINISAQKKNTLKNNNIKSITEYKQDMAKGGNAKIKEAYTLYDSDGNVLEEIAYDAAGKVKTHFKYQFNSDGNKTKETEFTPDGKVLKVTEYKWDGDLKMEKNIYDGAGKLKSKKIYLYEYMK